MKCSQTQIDRKSLRQRIRFRTPVLASKLKFIALLFMPNNGVAGVLGIGARREEEPAVSRTNLISLD